MNTASRSSGYGRRVLLLCLAVAAILVAGLLYWLFRPLPNVPQPATSHCLPTGPDDGALIALDFYPERLYGMGMTYSGHIAETASSYDPDVPPPVFSKVPGSILKGTNVVTIPSRQDWLAAAERLEPGLGAQLNAEFASLPALLDYEVELGFVLLEDVTAEQLAEPDFAPMLGYFIANDLTSRSFQVLGRHRENQYDYWGAAKSFSGFTVTGKQAWVPVTQKPNSVLCTTLVTTVNDELRQSQSTTNLIYTPKQMLGFILEAFPDAPLARGDMVLTGTPPGVAMVVPRWRGRLADLLRISRTNLLAMVIDTYQDDPRFLQAGDRVTVSSPLLGTAPVIIAE